MRSKKNKTINFPDEAESKNKMELSRNGSKLNKFSSLLRPKKNPFKLKKTEKPINYEQIKKDLKNQVLKSGNGEKYRLEEEIGLGAFGVVYSGVRLSDDKKVSLDLFLQFKYSADQ